MRKLGILWAVLLIVLVGLACQRDTIFNLTTLGTGGAVTEEEAQSLVEEVVVTPSSVETINGDRFQLNAQAFAGSRPVQVDAFFIWSSSAPLVANIVRTSGAVAQVKAENPGEAEIIARVGKAEGRARIKVHPASVNE